MKREPRWIGRSVLDAAHDELISQFGGLEGTRDESVLESALMRPQQIFQYEEEISFSRLCAAYGFAITTSHPYNDANKRTAFAAMMLFARFNDMTIDAPEAEVVKIMYDTATSHSDEPDLAYWLDNHLVSNVRS